MTLRDVWKVIAMSSLAFHCGHHLYCCFETRYSVRSVQIHSCDLQLHFRSLCLSRRDAVMTLRASRLISCAILKLLILIDRLWYGLRLYNFTHLLITVAQLFTRTDRQTDTGSLIVFYQHGDCTSEQHQHRVINSSPRSEQKAQHRLRHTQLRYSASCWPQHIYRT